MTDSCDVIVIGAGPAGYVAAIRCAQLGLRTTVIDDWLNERGKPVPGGTCLNAGCIPSKALLESSELFHRAQQEFSAHGIHAERLAIDLATMMERKRRIVDRLTSGIEALFKSGGISWLQGRGCLLENHQVRFTPHGSDTPEILDAGHVILASGSQPATLATATPEGRYIVDSSGALAFDSVPGHVAIIGAGVIGLELGSVWRRLGSRVTLLEAQDNFLPMADEQIASAALKQFTRQGLDIRLGMRVISTEIRDRQVQLQCAGGEDEAQLFTADRLVVAVGRVPRSQDLAAPECNLLLDERGYVHVDEFCATNLPGVYAIGDLVRGPMLAHKGSEEGMAVAESIATGRALSVELNHIPSVVYTSPEIAWVGQTEQELRALGNRLRVGQFPFSASGRAQAMEATEGMVKIIADADTDRILGVHILGAAASELIAEAVLALEYSASSEDIARTVHAHPTLAEAFHEAALAVDGRAIHLGKRRVK